jgi:hypothetical protein
MLPSAGFLDGNYLAGMALFLPRSVNVGIYEISILERPGGYSTAASAPPL